jgi:methyl-accepting chemotaxis protein
MHEISRNVQQASQGTEDVSRNIAGVTRGSELVGASAQQVLGAAGELNRQSERLTAELKGFLATVRAA